MLIFPGTISSDPLIVVIVLFDPIFMNKVEPPIFKFNTFKWNNVAYVCDVDIETAIFGSIIISDPINRFDRVPITCSVSERVHPLYVSSELFIAVSWIEMICPNLFIFILLGYWYSIQLLSDGGTKVDWFFDVGRIFIVGNNGSFCTAPVLNCIELNDTSAFNFA